MYSGYNSYHGRSPWKKFLKIIALAAVVLILLGVAAVAYLQQFLVVSNDGVRLDLPFFHREEEVQASPSPSQPITEPIVIVTPEPTPTPQPEPQGLAPVELPWEALSLSSDTVFSLIEAGGGDCALFDMKDDNGSLMYFSSIALAQSTHQSYTHEELNTAIAALNETEGLYTIARVSCFKDHNITDYERSLSIFTNSDYRWTDPDGIRWISPTNSDVRDYLTQICVELAQLGFDEILLDNAGYPAQGNLHYIKKGEAYDQAQFSSVIGAFYTQVADALEDYDVTLSIVTTADALAGTDTLTGQTPETLSICTGRLWMRSEDGVLYPYQPGEAE